jgi:hypothetical protein
MTFLCGVSVVGFDDSLMRLLSGESGAVCCCTSTVVRRTPLRFTPVRGVWRVLHFDTARQVFEKENLSFAEWCQWGRDL